MRNLFALVGAGTIAFVGLGWYLDWYKLSRQPSTSGNQTVQIDVHPEKTVEDLRKGFERGGQIFKNFSENSNATQAPPSPQTPATEGSASKFFSPTSATTAPQ